MSGAKETGLSGWFWYYFAVKLRNLAPVAVVAAAIASSIACGTSTDSSSADATATSAATTMTTPTPQSPTDIFTTELRAGGIFPSPEQVPLMIPGAVGNCDALTSTTLPDSQKYSKMVELARLLGKGKNIFDLQSTSETYMNASIRAYCPQFERLIPS